jgi:hypothetical protein
MSTTPRQTPDQVRRNPRLLLAIGLLFFGSHVLAGILRFSGWRPPATRAHGELLQPPADLRRITPIETNGRPYRWEPAQRTWRIVVAPSPDCIEACVKLGQQLRTVWQLMGPDAEHLQVLWIGEPPKSVPRGGALHVLRADDALRAGLPRLHPVAGEPSQGVPVYVIDPNGFVVLRYAPGFDPAGLRADLSKLLKLL